MKYVTWAVLILAGMPLLAQTAKDPAPAAANPIVVTVRQMAERYGRNLAGAADEMPAAKYNYRPTPDQITFAHLIVHSAEANNALCAAVAGEQPRESKLAESDSKEALTKALKDSFTYCQQVLDKADDSSLGQTFTLGSQTGTRGSALVRLVAGWADHYSAASMYLRLNNLLPPSAKK